MSRNINTFLGECLVNVNDEERTTKEERTILEQMNVEEYLDMLLDVHACVSSTIHKHPEYREMNWLEFMSKSMAGEIEDE